MVMDIALTKSDQQCCVQEIEGLFVHGLSEWLYRGIEVVMVVCSDQERSTMLHAQDDYAFGVACEKGLF